MYGKLSIIYVCGWNYLLSYYRDVRTWRWGCVCLCPCIAKTKILIKIESCKKLKWIFCLHSLLSIDLSIGNGQGNDPNILYCVKKCCSVYCCPLRFLPFAGLDLPSIRGFVRVLPYEWKPPFLPAAGTCLSGKSLAAMSGRWSFMSERMRSGR